MFNIHNIYNYFTGGGSPTTPEDEEEATRLAKAPITPAEEKDKGIPAAEKEVVTDKSGREWSELKDTEVPISTRYLDTFYNMTANAANALKEKANQAYEAASSIGQVAGQKIGAGVVELAKWTLLTPETQDEYRETIHRISGNDHLSHLIDAMAPGLINSFVQEKTKDYPQSLKTLIEHEEQFIENLGETILLKIASNAALDVERKAQEEAHTDELVEIPNLTLAVLSDLAGVFKKHFEVIEPRYREVEAIEDETERTEALKQLFTPLVDELLAIGFPNGAADLKVNSLVQNYAFSYIKNGLLDYTQKIFAEALKPAHHEESDLLVFDQEGGQALKELVKLFAAKGVDAAKDACETNNEAIVGFLDAYIKGKDATIVKAHLAEELAYLAKTKDPNLEFLWSMLSKNIESFSTRILSKLAQTSKHEDKNVTTKALKSLIDITVSFFADKGVAFDQELDRIEKLPNKEEIAEEKKKLFAPFITELLIKTGLEGDPLIAKIKDEYGPTLIETLYKEGISMFPILKEEKSTLDHILVGNDVIKELIGTSKTSQSNKQSIELSVDPLELIEDEEKDILPSFIEIHEETSALEKGCEFLAKDAKEIVLSYIAENQDDVAKAISSYFGHNQTTVAGRELAEAFAAVLTSGDQNTKKALDFAENALKSSVFKVFTLVGENETVANGLHHIVALLTNRIPLIDAQVKEIRNSTILTDEEKDKALNALFTPLVEEIFTLGGTDEKGNSKIAAALPVPESLKPFALKALKTSILPKLVSRIYLELTSAQHQMQGNEEELAKLVSSAPQGIIAIADYVNKFVPFYLKKNADKITDLVMQKGGKYFDLMGQEKKAEIESLLARNIKVAATDEGMNPAWKAVASFAQGFITKAFLGAAKNLDLAEGHGKTAEKNPLLINLLLGAMEMGDGHFKRITDLQSKQEQAHRLSHTELLQHFFASDALHPALAKDLDPSATAEEKKAHRIEFFFKPLARNLVKIAGMDNIEDFPLPEPFKKSGMKLFQEEILPEVLMGIYNEVLKPQNINKIMINVIDKLEGAADSFTAETDLEPVALDPEQRELNLQIGNLIKSFINMMPESTDTLFSINVIKKMSTEALGNAVRKKTNATTLLDVVNSLLTGITITPPDVNDPRTQEQIDEENFQVAKELQSRATTFISNQARKSVRNTIIEKWDTFQKNFDDVVERYLGAPGKAVKSFFDWIFGGIMRIFLPVLDFLLFGVIWNAVELHIWNKAGEAINNSKMPIHENLAFGITERAINTISDQLEEARKDQRHKEALAAEERKQEILQADRIKRELIHAQTVNSAQALSVR